MATLPNSINTDLSRGFTVSQVAEKHGWAEPMVWSLALEGREEIEGHSNTVPPNSNNLNPPSKPEKP